MQKPPDWFDPPTEVEVDPTLVAAFQDIAEKDAREEALSLLAIGSHEVELPRIPGDTTTLFRSIMVCGLSEVAPIIKLEMSRRVSKPTGHGVVAEELKQLAAAMRKVAGSLNTLTPTALEWIEVVPLFHAVQSKPFPVGQKWHACKAEEAFSVQRYSAQPGSSGWPVGPAPVHSALAVRLQSMAEILDYVETSVRADGRKQPGIKHALPSPPADFGIMNCCAEALLGNGRPLTHLRAIAEAIYRWGLGTDPAPAWADREETAAKRRARRLLECIPTPPKSSGGR